LPGFRKPELKLARLTIDVMAKGPVRIASLRDIERSDAVLVLGEDVTNVAPRMALSLRQSTRQAPMEVARRKACRFGRMMPSAKQFRIRRDRSMLLHTPGTTRLDSVATEFLRETPDAMPAWLCCGART